MSHRSSGHSVPLPHGHEFLDLPRQTRYTGWKSSARSRSVPNIRSNGRNDNDSEITRYPLISVEDCDGAITEAATQNRLDGIQELAENKGTLQENYKNGYEVEDKSPHSSGDSALMENGGGDYTLSDERSRRRIDSDRMSETDTIVPRRNLNAFDVAALILNKMVGTGIFTTPGAVLFYTKSKPISLILWATGGVFTSLFILVYLEFGSALPFNGGELIYLDEIYPHPELLSTILFSGFFLVLGNSYGNSVTFAKQVLLASNSTYEKTTDLDDRLVRFIAVVILSAVSLLHYFSNKFGLFLNKLFALFKTILLLTVFIAGAKAAGKEGSGFGDFSQTHGMSNPADGLAAMVLIFYSYQGWENANYVAGEIRAPTRTLKIGAFLAVGLVTLLYVLVTLAYYLACDYKTITSHESDLGVAILFAPRAFGSSLGLKLKRQVKQACPIIAANGRANNIPVKQAIAVQRILPFYKFFQKDIDTPKGALMLHWVSSVILILICPTTADGYSFAVGLFTYGHIIIGTIVTLGLYRLPVRMRQQWPDWQPEIITNKYIMWFLPIVFAGGNLLVIIWGAKPRHPGTTPRYWWPVIFFLIVTGSFIYWATMMITRVKVNEIDKNGENKTIGSIIGFEVRIYNETDERVPQAMQSAMVQSRLDGSRRRVGYKFSKGFEAVRIWGRNTKDLLGSFLF
ncbi:amino acid permease-domain-containing protein [Tricladium varicosporioides]|nr:amino acid permease-domain-containing protein [Hymenoscyphus varicosporioides]